MSSSVRYFSEWSDTIKEITILISLDTIDLIRSMSDTYNHRLNSIPGANTGGGVGGGKRGLGWGGGGGGFFFLVFL